MNIDQEVWDNREKEEDVLARLLPGQHFYGTYYEDGTPLILQDTVDIHPIKLGGPLGDGDYYPSHEKAMRNNPAV